MSESVEIKLPEDQQEGTVSNIGRWLKAAGETVSADEPLIEIETDKVNTEVASPATGILREILKQEGDEVMPGEVLGVIETGKSAAHSSAPETAAPQSPAATVADVVAAPVAIASDRSRLLSPSVRRLFSQHGLDVSMVSGTGRGGRITYWDVRRFLDEGGKPVATAAPVAPRPAAPLPVSDSSFRSRMVPHDGMRRRIADHMVESLLRVAPHVTSVFEMDMSAIMRHRQQNKAAFAEKGVKLTYTAYFTAAVVEAVKASPEVNSRFHESALEIFDDVNIGIGTALGEKGLIVPVIHRAQNHNLMGMATQLQDLTGRAREGKLAPHEVQNGTFTISNHGVSGSLIAAPVVINQPQSAILGIGKMQKRMVVVELDGQDAAVIKPMCYVTLSIDHRALDAFQANAFLSRFVEVIENWK